MRRIVIDIKFVLAFFDFLVQKAFPDNPGSRGDYYCGITNDLDRRAGEHKAEFMGHVECDSKDTAIDVETLLGDQGYDIGKKSGNGAKDNSIFVYIYKKTPYTIEDAPDDV